MIEALTAVMQETAKEGIASGSSFLPDFAKDLKPERINNFDDADKPLKCRNEDLAGKNHPDTGVPFVEKTVQVNGESKEVVVPEFPSLYDVQLDEPMYQESDAKQFDYANGNLKEAIGKDPELRSKFTEEQIEQINNGDTPDGYTWHHDAEPGKLQLVDSELHAKTGHTGGKVFWGGGNENR